METSRAYDLVAARDLKGDYVSGKGTLGLIMDYWPQDANGAAYIYVPCWAVVDLETGLLLHYEELEMIPDGTAILDAVKKANQ